MQIVASPSDPIQFSKECARLHKELFSTYHLTTKLPDKLLRLYYFELLRLAHKTCFLIDGSDQVVGFAILSYKSPSLKNIFYRNKISALSFIFCNFFAIFLISFRRKNSFRSSADLRLISIACKNGNRNFGASHLFDKLTDDVSVPIGLTVNTRNARGLNFYIKKGFKIENVHYDKFNMIKLPG